MTKDEVHNVLVMLAYRSTNEVPKMEPLGLDMETPGCGLCDHSIWDDELYCLKEKSKVVDSDHWCKDYIYEE